MRIVNDEIIDGMRTITYESGHVVKFQDQSIIPPKPLTVLPVTDFINLFTDDEMNSIFDSEDKKVKRWVFEMQVHKKIDLEKTRTIDAMQDLVDQGILTESRRNELLGIS